MSIINEKASGKSTVFAKKAGIPPGTFHSYLKGRLPHPEQLIRLCETYDINLNWLLTGKGEKYIIENDKKKHFSRLERITKLLQDMEEDDLEDIEKYTKKKVEDNKIKERLFLLEELIQNLKKAA